jgi:acyl-CoA oxidase
MQLKNLKRLLDNDNFELREQLKLLLQDPIFHPRYDLTLDESRELAYKRLQRIFASGLANLFDFEKDPRRIFALHEMVAYVDGALATKLTVQMNLFGGTVLKFSDRQHWQTFLEKVTRLRAVGCFALTELGYGNNAVEMETEAYYRPETDDFILRTPTTLAQKFWITNGACHAQWAVVFAQLKVQGKSQGVHGFLVRIRKDDLSPAPGVVIKDMGHKIGLNGVDNALLSFHDVIVSKQSLLSPGTSIDPHTQIFTSPIPGVRQRFLRMADQLLSGRVCIASMMISSTKIGLIVALRYSQKRKAVGLDGRSSWPLINFQLQRNALIPLLARTYGLAFALNRVKNDYTFFESSQKQIIECCAIKALASWNAEEVGAVARERCGGIGFLSSNRFGELIEASHAGITAEGDNGVLMQKVAKELIENLDLPSYLRLKSSSMLGKVQWISFDLAGLATLLGRRRDYLLVDLAEKLQSARKKDKKVLFKLWMQHESDNIQSLAKAWGEAFAFETFKDILSEKENQDPLHEKLALLFGIDCLTRSLDFYLMKGYLNAKQAHRVQEMRSELIRDLSPFVSYFLDAFDVPESMIHAPIASDFTEGFHLTHPNAATPIMKMPSKKKLQAIAPII